MSDTGFALNDQTLFPFCVKHIETLNFLSENTQKILRKLDKRVRESSLSASDGNDLIELWRNLMTDAIHALKAHDRREKAWIQRDQHPFSEQKLRTAARCQNVYGAESLFQFFTEFTKFEQLLYGTEQHYRDHVAHPIRVWMIGIKMIVEWGGIQNLDFGEEKEAGEIEEVEKWAAWTIIALCHDLGYPLEKAHKVTDQVDKMMEFFGNLSTGRYRYSFQVHHQSLIDIMLRAVASKVMKLDARRPICGQGQASSIDHTVAEARCEADNCQNGVESRIKRDPVFTTVIQPKYYAKFSHSFEEFQHGIISVLVLLKNLVYFMEMDFDLLGHGSLNSEDARQFQIRREILRSIAAHTCPEVYHLKLNTPSFLLIVCDDLQEWGRPTLASMRLEASPASSTSSSQDTEVLVKSCTLNPCELSCAIFYPSHGKGEGKVKSEFRRYHKLLRAALGDDQRRFVFEWKVILRNAKGEQDTELLFRYDSSKPPFQELDVSKDGRSCTDSLFDDKCEFSSSKSRERDRA